MVLEAKRVADHAFPVCQNCHGHTFVFTAFGTGDFFSLRADAAGFCVDFGGPSGDIIDPGPCDDSDEGSCVSRLSVLVRAILAGDTAVASLVLLELFVLVLLGLPVLLVFGTLGVGVWTSWICGVSSAAAVDFDAGGGRSGAVGLGGSVRFLFWARRKATT